MINFRVTRGTFTCLYDVVAAWRRPDIYLRESLYDPRFYTRDHFGFALLRQLFPRMTSRNFVTLASFVGTRRKSVEVT